MPDTPTKTPKKSKKTKGKTKPIPALKPADVLTWLIAHPAFFEKHKEALGTLSVPKKSGNILSLHALKAEKIAKEAESLKIRQTQLISTARNNADVAQSVFTAVLALIRCRTLADLRKYLQTGLQEHLEIDAVRLFTAGETSATSLTADELTSLCPRPIVLEPVDPARHRPLFGPKTADYKSTCLMLLGTTEAPLGLLAFASTEPARFHAGQATELADFLRQVTGTVLQHTFH